MFCNFLAAQIPDDLITSPEKLVQQKRDSGVLNGFNTPESVIIVYQPSTLEYLLKNHPEFHTTKVTSYLYISEDSKVAILGGWGIGAPALSFRVELLAVLGVKRFIGVGTAGGLLDNFQVGDHVVASKALGEDGVAHLYLDGADFAEADPGVNAKWMDYASDFKFREGIVWSFSALCRERYSDVVRVTAKGCQLVEMETATLLAIAKERNVEAMGLYLISDIVSLDPWKPAMRDPKILDKVHLVAERAFQYCLATEPGEK